MARRKTEKMAVSGRFWLERGEQPFLGHGRIELLEQIAASGSISQAARAMGMSYKAAWDAVDAINNVADEALVRRTAGGRHGGGTQLTDHGRKLIEVYRAAEQEYQHFLRRLGMGVADFDHFHQLMRRLSMKTSARNQFPGRITQIRLGAVNAEVIMAMPGGDELVAIVTNESVKGLALAVGSEVFALIKASWVILTACDAGLRTSARNQLCGIVVSCMEGAVNGEVVIELAGSRRIAAIVTNESIRNLGLKQGVPACALIKASHIILAVSD
ncbi:MAG TPA: TOBE domain-containing protein [Gammaproteobacteria bacterium]